MPSYACKYCGIKAPSVASLISSPCYRHPDGPNHGKHVLYEGTEKSQYTCKYCGAKASSLTGLVGSSCYRHPDGANKGKHSPAL